MTLTSESPWVSPDQQEVRIAERVDKSRFDRVISNLSYIRKLMKERNPEKEEFSPKVLIEFHNRCDAKGAYTAVYTKSKNSSRFEGEGRYYTVGSIGLQTVPKIIRSFLAGEVYHDIDMKNAHPSIIKGLCTANNIVCPQLSLYNSHRQQVIDVVNAETGTSDGKVLILKVINGGACPTGSPTLRAIKSELSRIAIAFRTAGVSTQFEAECTAKTRANQAPLEHRMLISLVNSIENRMLFIAWNHFFELGFRPATLQFDGLFVDRITSENDLRTSFPALRKKIFNELHVDVEWDIKPSEMLIDEREMTKTRKVEYEPNAMAKMWWDECNGRETVRIFGSGEVYFYEERSRLWRVLTNVSQIGENIAEALKVHLNDEASSVWLSKMSNYRRITEAMNRSTVYLASTAEAEAFGAMLNGRTGLIPLKGGFANATRTISSRSSTISNTIRRATRWKLTSTSVPSAGRRIPKLWMKVCTRLLPS